MNIDFESHNYGLELIKLIHPSLWTEITDALLAITDEEIGRELPGRKTQKSISGPINSLIARELTKRGWVREASIFNDPIYKLQKRWRLDFAKTDGAGAGVAIEVAFNHAEAIAWNLLKPVLSSQLNHVEKEFQTDMGVIIMATEALKAAGGFDSAVGTFEQFKRYLIPLGNILTVPLVLVGLKAPTSFLIVHDVVGNKKIGRRVDVLGESSRPGKPES